MLSADYEGEYSEVAYFKTYSGSSVTGMTNSALNRNLNSTTITIMTIIINAM